MNTYEWTTRGGAYRHSNATPRWIKRADGRWECKELVPYGKADDAYREEHYHCPRCLCDIMPANDPYTFECSSCDILLAWTWGGLIQKKESREDGMYVLED